MHFVTLDVFTDTPFLGNPLAIVIVEDRERASLEGTRDRPAGTKQLVAREFNLSETVFLFLRPGETLAAPDRSSAEREIGIFTIDAELPFAGHPTIGTAHFLLHHLGWTFVTTLLPRAGPISISRGPSSSSSSSSSSSPPLPGAVTARIPHDVHRHARTLRTLPAPDIHRALHPDPAVRAAELDAPLFSIVRGMTFLLVRLAGPEQLAGVAQAAAGRLDLGACEGLLDAGPWGQGFVARYYYCSSCGAGPGQGGEDGDGGVRTEVVRARMVELAAEDPATGSAACALACHLALQGGAGTLRCLVTQGVEMGRKSEIVVEVDAGGAAGAGGRATEIKEVRLRGTARMVMSGEISV